MAYVSFQVIDGVDKGRSFSHLETPITIGREEGNVVRLNDERVSRFHAKVQEDQGQVVLTDLESTNGTSVNGEPIQLRLLRPGDRVGVGRSILMFGTLEEIAASLKNEGSGRARSGATKMNLSEGRDSALGMGTDLSSSDSNFTLDPSTQYNVFARTPPRLPTKLSPAQAAQLSEVLDFLHRALADATGAVHIAPKAGDAKLPMENWQRVQAVLSFLAKYSRLVADPGEGS